MTTAISAEHVRSVDACPSRKPAGPRELELGTLRRCLLSDIGDLFARQLEVVLENFGRHTRLKEAQSLQPSHITDYFVPKHSIPAWIDHIIHNGVV